MDPFLLQKQLRDNATDVQDFYQDLKAWGEEMKRRETEKSPPAQSEDVKLMDQAYVEKEKGNKFVKLQKWDDAISCYNRAIECYPRDPIFYANRALCLLKKESFVKAELDCTMSLKLDASYVKAYQRRAAARQALNKLMEAEADLIKVLKLEPNNKESLGKLMELRSRIEANKMTGTVLKPVSQFTANKTTVDNSNKTKVMENSKKVGNSNKVIETKKFWSLDSDVDSLIAVKAVTKSIKTRSKKPLKRIKIEEVLEAPKE